MPSSPNTPNTTNTPNATANSATPQLVSKTPKNASKTVFVGLSGGVDSSVSAALLKKQGYHVVGVYMKNWSKDLPGMECPWARDLADAKRVAVKLNIPFRIFDFETEYKQKVVDYMLAEFKKGNTPNPDIMCNQEIKFKLFYETAREQGADFIATGHYAGTDGKNLLRAKDDNKDQTYFLYRISEDAIAHTIFPLANLLKPDVKKLAEAFNLHNAYRKESMGVCFVGDVGIKDFLQEYIKKTPGEIRELETGKLLGTHDGAIFYTLGQRKGLNIASSDAGLPYYVAKKDLEKNILYLSKNLNARDLWTREVKLKDIIIRNPQNSATGTNLATTAPLFARLRHRGEFIPVTLKIDIPSATPVAKNTDAPSQATTASAQNSVLASTASAVFDQAIKSPAPGQSVVLYGGEDAKICLGGGIIE